MSTNGMRDYRPRAHFTPARGWINDPNGLCYHEGRYHLFCQHHPSDGEWGPMHWAHAVSDDLMRWEHLPIALYPDAQGMIFSGSAVSDVHNLSGLAREGQTPLIALYTCHGAQEEQAMAYSLDGIHFAKHDANPVIANPGIADFRDPKLFWNPVLDGWSLVLAAKDRVQFYRTDDFVRWEKTGEFGPEGNVAPGVWECPDLVPLDFEGETIWMLVVSMSGDDESGHAFTQYFLGAFDGRTFTCTYPAGRTLRVDEGSDDYAGVTFNGVAEPTMMGWALNWVYAKDTPTGIYRGQLTLPRRLSLVRTAQGPRLAATPVLPALRDGVMLRDVDVLPSEHFVLRVRGEGPCRVRLHNAAGNELLLGIDERNRLYVDRTRAGASDFHESFAAPPYGVRCAERYFAGAYDMRIVFDVSILEAFVDRGTRNMTMAVYPDAPYDGIDVRGARAELFLWEA